jgi:hypothetical protein
MPWREGPAVTIEGIPESFQPGGEPVLLTVEFDNAGLPATHGYVPAFTVTDTSGSPQASHIKAEVRGNDGSWQAATVDRKPGPAVFAVPLGDFSLSGGTQSVEARLSFTEDAPAIPVEIYADGFGHDEDGEVWSSATWYDSRIGTSGGDTGGEDPQQAEGAVMSLAGIPAEGFRAGDGWQELTLRLDNTGLAASEAYAIGVHLGRSMGEGEFLKSSQIKAEVYGLGDGEPGWQPVEINGSEDIFSLSIGAVPLVAGEILDIRLRLSFTSDAPAGPIRLATVGHDESGSDVYSETATYRTAILAAQRDDGNDPAPDGDAEETPSGDANGGQGRTGRDRRRRRHHLDHRRHRPGPGRGCRRNHRHQPQPPARHQLTRSRGAARRAGFAPFAVHQLGRGTTQRDGSRVVRRAARPTRHSSWNGGTAGTSTVG